MPAISINARLNRLARGYIFQGGQWAELDVYLVKNKAVTKMPASC